LTTSLSGAAPAGHGDERCQQRAQPPAVAARGIAARIGWRFLTDSVVIGFPAVHFDGAR
jgi:hypothetical protein